MMCWRTWACGLTVHELTRRDLLEGNADLIESAARLLAGQQTYGLAVTIKSAPGMMHRVQARALNATPGGRADKWPTGEILSRSHRQVNL